jgi:hypothetical protein
MSYRIPHRYIKRPISAVLAVPIFFVYILKCRCRLFPNFSWRAFALIYRRKRLIRTITIVSGIYAVITFWRHPGDFFHLLILQVWLVAFITITVLGYVHDGGLVLVFPWYRSNTFELHLVDSVNRSTAKEMKSCYERILGKASDMNAFRLAVLTPNKTLLFRKSNRQRLDVVALQVVQNGRIVKAAPRSINWLSALIYLALYGEREWTAEKCWQDQLELILTARRLGFTLHF